IVNWLRPLGADRKVIAAEFDRLNPPAARPPLTASRKMDAILFDPDTSRRRALILILGAYGAESPSQGEPDPLIAKLLDLYENDPAPGTHGGGEGTRRQGKKEERLNPAQAELSNLTDKGARRWFVNSQGQTFTMIDGPVEFLMGSPANEPDRD